MKTILFLFSVTLTLTGKILLLLGPLPNMLSEILSAHTVLGWGLVDFKLKKILFSYLYSNFLDFQNKISDIT